MIDRTDRSIEKSLLENGIFTSKKRAKTKLDQRRKKIRAKVSFFVFRFLRQRPQTSWREVLPTFAFPFFLGNAFLKVMPRAFASRKQQKKNHTESLMYSNRFLKTKRILKSFKSFLVEISFNSRDLISFLFFSYVQLG